MPHVSLVFKNLDKDVAERLISHMESECRCIITEGVSALYIDSAEEKGGSCVGDVISFANEFFRQELLAEQGRAPYPG